MFRLLISALFAALLATPTWAQDYVVNVNGIVCGFCSIGVAKKVSKLPFVDRSRYKKGVSVDVQNQMVTVAVKDNAAMDQQALFEAIESGGYNPVALFELNSDGERVEYAP